MTKVTKFTRAFVNTCIEYKINRINTIRDYDIVADRDRGLSYEQIAIKHGITKQAVAQIIKKLQ